MKRMIWAVTAAVLLAASVLCGCDNADTPNIETAKKFVEYYGEDDLASISALLNNEVVFYNSSDKNTGKAGAVAELSYLIEMQMSISSPSYEAVSGGCVVSFTRNDRITEKILALDTKDTVSKLSLSVVNDKITKLRFDFSQYDALLSKDSRCDCGVLLDYSAAPYKIAVVPHCSPAEDAGIKEGDILKAIDGKSVTDMGLDGWELYYMLRGTEGTKRTLTIMSEGKESEKTLTVSSKYKDGAVGVELDSDMPQIISAVTEGSPAEIAGIRKGDEIVSVDNTSVSDMTDYKSLRIGYLLRGIKGSEVKILVKRDSENMEFIIIRA